MVQNYHLSGSQYSKMHSSDGTGIRVPGIRWKISLRQVKQGFSSFFCHIWWFFKVLQLLQFAPLGKIIKYDNNIIIGWHLRCVCGYLRDLIAYIKIGSIFKIKEHWPINWTFGALHLEKSSNMTKIGKKWRKALFN